MPTSVVTTTISPACLTCGIISKSGKMSCCADGGSWFGNCGSAGDANFGHTWHEGIQSCKSQQLQIVVGEQIHALQPKGNGSFHDNSLGMRSETVVAVSQIFASSSAYLSTRVPSTPQNTLPANTSVIKAVRRSIANDTITTTSVDIVTSQLSTRFSITQVNETVRKSTIRSSLSSISLTTVSRMFASVSAAEREYEPLLHLVVHSMIITIVCWS